MDGFGKVLSGWSAAPFAAAAVVAAALWVNTPAPVLLGIAAIFAFTAVVAHSPTSVTARALALGGVGAAWLTAPFSGVALLGRLTLPELALIPAVAAALLAPRRRMDIESTLKSAPVGFLLLIVVGGLVGGLADGLNTGNLLYVGRLAAGGLAALLVLRRFTPSGGELRWLAMAWVGGALISAVVGLAGSSGPSGRPVGLTGHPNQLAMMSIMALPVIVALASRNGLAVTRRLGAAAAGGVLLVAVVASGSRSGLIAGGVVIFLISYHYLGTAVTIAAGGLTTAAIFLAGIPERLSEGATTSAFARLAADDLTQNSDVGRVELLQAQLDALRGMTALVGAGFEIGEARPHNVFLAVWGAAGLAGLIGLIGLVVPIVTGAVRRRRDTHPMAVAVAIGFTGYLVAVSFNNAFELPFVWTFYALWERWRTSHP
jgi:hypothetical protein